jgi:hypothetical protein
MRDVALDGAPLLPSAFRPRTRRPGVTRTAVLGLELSDLIAHAHSLPALLSKAFCLCLCEPLTPKVVRQECIVHQACWTPTHTHTRTAEIRAQAQYLVSAPGWLLGTPCTGCSGAHPIQTRGGCNRTHELLAARLPMACGMARRCGTTCSMRAAAVRKHWRPACLERVVHGHPSHPGGSSERVAVQHGGHTNVLSNLSNLHVYKKLDNRNPVAVLRSQCPFSNRAHWTR